MIDHCIALFQKKEQEKAVLLYFGECLRIITENTAKTASGTYIQAKLSDILEPRKEEERTADEIIGNIRGKVEKMK